MTPDDLRVLAALLQDEAADDDDPKTRRFGCALAVLVGIEAHLARGGFGVGPGLDLENLRRAVRAVADAAAGLYEGAAS